MSENIDGFDPLAERLPDDPGDKSMLAEATRRIVLNILKSYTGYFDLFAELTQNGLDALEARLDAKEDFTPKLWVSIDIKNGLVRVVDNGSGMSLQEFRYCFRPSVSFKQRGQTRGHKGVGSTFLAYGYQNIRMFTRQDGTEVCGQLNNGRAWAEDETAIIDRPVLKSIKFDVPELSGEQSGTAVEVRIGKGQRPDLNWLGATSAEQWRDVLRAKTPLGGVYLSGKRTTPKAEITLKVTDAAGVVTEARLDKAEYYYPHEMPNLTKVKSIDEIDKALQKIPGDFGQKQLKLSSDFRRLDAVYEIWTKDDILEESGPFDGIHKDDAARELIARHDISVYGCFVSTAKSWTEFNNQVLGLRKNANLLRGGLVLASDYMVQGDLLVIPLTSAIGYQNNTHVIVHLVDGNPDMGRKVFQPEVKAVAEDLAKKVVAIFKRYLSLMREDTGAPVKSAAKRLWEWKVHQTSWRDANPLYVPSLHRSGGLTSAPQCEQDVVALFHELVGADIVRGYHFLATSEFEQYDTVFLTLFSDNDRHVYNSESNPLGVNPTYYSEEESQPLILEYKYDLDGLIADFEKEEKFAKDVDLVVCWSIGNKYKESYEIASYLIGDSGVDRMMFGATHSLIQERARVLDIICLEDLVELERDPAKVEARNRSRFG